MIKPAFFGKPGCHELRSKQEMGEYTLLFQEESLCKEERDVLTKGEIEPKENCFF